MMGLSVDLSSICLPWFVLDSSTPRPQHLPQGRDPMMNIKGMEGGCREWGHRERREYEKGESQEDRQEEHQGGEHLEDEGAEPLRENLI